MVNPVNIVDRIGVAVWELQSPEYYRHIDSESPGGIIMMKGRVDDVEMGPRWGVINFEELIGAEYRFGPDIEHVYYPDGPAQTYSEFSRALLPDVRIVQGLPFERLLVPECSIC